MSQEKGIKIKFEVDESPIRSALSRIEKESRQLQSSLKDVQKLLDLDPSNVTLLAQKQEILQRSIENTSQKLQAMQSAQEKVTESYQKWQENQKAIEKNSRAIDSMTEKLKESESALAKMKEDSNFDKTSEEFKNIEKQVIEYNNELKELQKTQKELTKNSKTLVDSQTYERYIRDTERLKINLSQLNQQQEELQRTMSESNSTTQSSSDSLESQSQSLEELERITRESAEAEERRKNALKQTEEAEKKAKIASDNYNKSLENLKNSANEVKNDLEGIANAAGKVIGAVGAAATAAGTASLKVGMDFSKSMSHVESLTRASAEEMEKLSESAKEGGAKTSKTAAEAADALGYMALAGWDVNDMLSSLNTMIKSSEAGQMDLAVNSDLVTDSLSALGLTAKDLTHYLDVVTHAQSASNTTMQDLLEAYIQCGGMLKQLNVPLEESASWLGILANRGIKGAEAGRALNSILVNLIGASSTSATALEELDASAFDANGHFIGLTETIELVSVKMNELGDNEEKINQLTARLGGKTQLDTLQALLSGVNGEFDVLNEKLNNSNKFLEETSKIAKDNLSGDLDNLQSILEATGITISESLDDSFRESTQNAIKSIDLLNNTLKSEESAEQIEKIGEAIGDLIDEAVRFSTEEAIPDLIDFLEWLAKNKDLVIAGIIGMGTAWGTWKLATVLLHLKQMTIDLKAAALAKKEMITVTLALTSAETAQTATVAASSLTLKDYASAALASKTAMTGLYAAIAMVTVALATLIARKIDEASAALMAENQLNEETRALYDQARAYDDAANRRRDEISEIEKKSQKAEELWQKITKLADIEGKATGDVVELKNAISEFNAVSGQNIEIVNDQIVGYDKLRDSMQEIINLDRKQAKLNYLQSDYEQAVYEIDDIKKQVAEAEDEYNKLRDASQTARKTAEEEYNKALTEAGSGFIKVINFSAYNEAQAIADLALDAEAQAAVRLSSLRQILYDTQSVIDEYESIKNDFDISTSTMTKEEAARYAAEQEAERLSELNRKNAEKILKDRQENQEKLEKKLEELDNRLTTRKITDDQYWIEKSSIVEKYRDEENSEWWKYFSEIEEHNEKELEEQIETLKKKQENSENYTEEMFYNELEIMISSLDKESELYKKYNDEILKGRKELQEELQKLTTESLKNQISDIENELKQVENKYNSELQEIISQRDNYFNKIYKPASLVSSKKEGDTEIFTLYDPEESYRKLVQFQEKFNDLQSKNISDNVMNWINNMDMETAEDTIDVLLSMTDEKLKSYSDSFDKYKITSEKMADDKYSSQIQELNEKFVLQVDELLSQLPQTASWTGQQTAQGFAQGLVSDTSLSESISTFTSNIINQIKNDLDIHSPSRITEELGQFTAQGFAQGFAPSFAIDAANNFTDSFINELIKKEPLIQEQLKNMMSVDTDNISSVLNYMSNYVNSLIPKLPDFSKITLPNFEISNVISQKDNTTSINELIEQNDDIIKLLNQLINVQHENQKIELDLDLSGELTTDIDKLVAIITRKINLQQQQSGRMIFNL